MRQQEACICDVDHDILLEVGSRSIELNFMLDLASGQNHDDHHICIQVQPIMHRFCVHTQRLNCSVVLQNQIKHSSK
jgi:hypothetical protein